MKRLHSYRRSQGFYLPMYIGKNVPTAAAGGGGGITANVMWRKTHENRNVEERKNVIGKEKIKRKDKGDTEVKRVKICKSGKNKEYDM